MSEPVICPYDREWCWQSNRVCQECASDIWARNELVEAALRKLVEVAKEKEWDDEDGYWLDGSCSVCKNMLYRKHLKSCPYAAAIAEAERLLGKEGE